MMVSLTTIYVSASSYTQDLVEFSTEEARTAAQEHDQLEAQTQPEGVLSVLRASMSFHLPPLSPTSKVPRAFMEHDIDVESGERLSEMSVRSPMGTLADDRKQPLL